MQERTTNARLMEMEESIRNFRYAKVIDEVAKRDLQLERRERDKGIRMGLFSNKFVKQHAADLFDSQALLDDLTESFQVIVPEMVHGFSKAASEGTLEGASVTVGHYSRCTSAHGCKSYQLNLCCEAKSVLLSPIMLMAKGLAYSSSITTICID